MDIFRYQLSSKTLKTRKLRPSNLQPLGTSLCSFLNLMDTKGLVKSFSGKRQRKDNVLPHPLLSSYCVSFLLETSIIFNLQSKTIREELQSLCELQMMIFNGSQIITVPKDEESEKEEQVLNSDLLTSKLTYCLSFTTFFYIVNQICLLLAVIGLHFKIWICLFFWLIIIWVA